MNGGGAASHDQSVGLLAGTALGGGTVVNYTTSFRTPDDVREEWAGHGVPAFAADEYERSLDAVVERLGVNQEHSRPSARDEVMQRGLDELGWHVDAMPRNVRGCDQGENCGYCGYGCRLGAKQSTVKTWLADAHAAGARIVVRARGTGARRGRRGARRRGRDGGRRTRDRARPRGRGRLRRDQHAGAAQALRACAIPTSGATCGCIRRPSSGACSTRRSVPGRARCRRSTRTSTATSTAATA